MFVFLLLFDIILSPALFAVQGSWPSWVAFPHALPLFQRMDGWSREFELPSGGQETLSVVCAATPYIYHRVTRVIDGDTIEIGNRERVRYLGIDAPGRGEAFYEEATAFNKRLTMSRLVQVDSLGEPDRYGRTLAFVYADGANLSVKMISNGLATLAYLYGPINIKYVNMLATVQREARDAKRGMWKECTSIDASDWKQFVGTLKTIRCQVGDAIVGRSIVFDVTQAGVRYGRIIIDKRILGLFAQSGVNPQAYYKNKTLEVTGVVKSSSKHPGFVLFVHHPMMIKVV